MPRHEFGILEANQIEEHYTYDPEKYNCISVDDDIILPLLEKLKDERFA